ACWTGLPGRSCRREVLDPGGPDDEALGGGPLRVAGGEGEGTLPGGVDHGHVGGRDDERGLAHLVDAAADRRGELDRVARLELGAGDLLVEPLLDAALPHVGGERVPDQGDAAQDQKHRKPRKGAAQPAVGAQEVYEHRTAFVMTTERLPRVGSITGSPGRRS